VKLWRDTYLESRRTMADAGEYTLDINLSDPITALWVEFRIQNGSTSNKAHTVADIVDAIEVLDGSDVIFSLDGYEAFALTAYHLGHIPYQLIHEGNSVTQNLFALVPFGRFLGDDLYALNPKKFLNPQVRVKWAATNWGTAGDTTFTTGTVTLTVVAMVMSGGPEPVGLIQSKEVYTWTTTSGGIEYIDLPNNLPLRSLLLRADKAATNISGVVSQVKLNCNAGAFVPLDMRMADYVHMLALSVPPFSYKHVFRAISGDTLYCVLKQDETLNLTPDQGDVTASYDNHGYGEGSLTAYLAGTATTSLKNFGAIVSGWCPYRTVSIPLGNPDVPSEWFPASDYTSVRLECTGAVASGSGYLVVQQERKY